MDALESRGKYTIEKVIGQGSYGTVHLVKLRGKSYALKEINLNNLKPIEIQRAFNEVTLLAKLSHKFIIKYRDSSLDHATGKLLIVTDYAECGDLAKAIIKQRGRPFDVQKVLNWFVQITLALQYIHSQNILHRDLKTQNVFLSRDYTIKLGDFGIARALGNSQDLASTGVGTPYYLSPEICMKQSYNGKSDMWALGCILYEMSALTRPFRADNFPHLMTLILEGKLLPLPSWTSDSVKELVANLMNRDPNKRPSTEEVLAYPALQVYLSIHVEKPKQKVSPIATRTLTSPEDSFAKKRSPASALNSNGSKLFKFSPKSVENSQKPFSTVTQIIPPSIIVTEYDTPERTKEDELRHRSASTRATPPVTDYMDKKLMENERKPRSASTRSTPPSVLITSNKHESKSTERLRKPRSATSTQNTSPVMMDPNCETGENVRKFRFTFTRSTPPSIVPYRKIENKLEGNERKPRSASIQPTPMYEKTDIRVAEDVPGPPRRLAISLSPPNRKSESKSFLPTFEKRSNTNITYVINKDKSPSEESSACILKTENRLEGNGRKPRSASIHTTPINGKTDNSLAEDVRSTRRLAISVSPPKRKCVSPPSEASSFLPTFEYRSNSNATYTITKDVSAAEKSTASILNDIDFGYSSEERNGSAESTDNSICEHSISNGESEFSILKGKGSDEKSIDISHCQHSQCHQCMIDMLWKNRIGGCVSRNNSDYLRLKEKLLLIFEPDLFQKVYVSLLNEWNGSAKNESLSVIRNLGKVLNYEQVQNLPLMMQLIQLNLTLTSSDSASMQSSNETVML